MKKKILFLKWSLTNILAITIFALAAIFFSSQTATLNVVGKIMVGAVILIYLIAAAYCGIICWKVDGALEGVASASNGNNGLRVKLKKQLSQLMHKADNVAFAANECPYIGLLGAITGIYFFMTGNSGLGGTIDASHIKEIMANSMTGIGIAFVPTITGVFFRIILTWEHHIVDHEIGYVLHDLKKKKEYYETY